MDAAKTLEEDVALSTTCIRHQHGLVSVETDDQQTYIGYILRLLSRGPPFKSGNSKGVRYMSPVVTLTNPINTIDDRLTVVMFPLVQVLPSTRLYAFIPDVHVYLL